MGCDIHLYVERRVDGKWVTADQWTDDKYDPGRKEVAYETRFYTGRNYDLFSILASVRNGSGFAGVKTGDGFEPIAEPRGMPEDCSPEVAAEAEAWEGDGHSHSYHTVADLMAYDWTQATRKVGWVGPSEWAQWKSRGRPDSWSGMIAGGGVHHLSEMEFAAAWEKLRVQRGYPAVRHASAHLREGDPNNDEAAFIALLGGGTPVCQVEWQVSYVDSAHEFLGKVLPRLWRLGTPEDVRIVFWFDN